MTNPPVPSSSAPPPTRDWPLWLNLLGAPFLFLCHLLVGYSLVPWACAAGKRWVLQLNGILFLAVLAALGVFCWREIRSAGTDTEPNVAVPLARHRQLAILGLMLTALFFLATLAQFIATLIIDPCPQ
jgi:hypothetical protein